MLVRRTIRGAVAATLGVLLLAAPSFSLPARETAEASPQRSRRSRAQQAPTAERIREIQTALAGKGHYSGEPTGKWDSKTVEAMKKFQAANDLPVTGKIDAKSLQKLGLGSEVAGVAPPRPAADRGSSQ